MDCKTAADRMAKDWERGATAEKGREALRAHLLECRECTDRSRQLAAVRATLRSLPPVPAPSDLRVRLSAVGARARTVRFNGARGSLSFSTAWLKATSLHEPARTRLKLHFHDVLRPLAVPLATGLCSAIVLFSMLVPNLTMERQGSPDVPTVLSTEATIKSMAPLGFSGDAIVDLVVDRHGRAVDYSIISGPGVNKEALRRSIENTLLFTVFTPGTTFGRPVPGKIRLTFRNSAIDVRG